MGQQNPLKGALRASGGVEGFAHSWNVPWTDRGTGGPMEGHLIRKTDGRRDGEIVGWVDPLMELLQGN